MGHKIHKHMSGGKSSSSPLNQQSARYKDQRGGSVMSQDYRDPKVTDAEIKARILAEREEAKLMGLTGLRGDRSMLVDEYSGTVTSPTPGGLGDRIAYIPSKESLPGIDPEIYELGRGAVKDSLSLVNRGMGGTAERLYGENLAKDLRMATSPDSYEAILRSAVEEGGKPGFEGGASEVDPVSGRRGYTPRNLQDIQSSQRMTDKEKSSILKDIIKSKLFNK